MLYAIVALLVLIADQALKYYVTLNIVVGETVVPFIPGIMSLVHYRNTGAAFSMLSGCGARWAFVLLAIAFTAATIYILSHRTIQSKLINWSMVLVSAGAVGNAIDRAFYGYVVDMFRTDFMNFAIFNIADIFITIGGFMLCLGILLAPDESAKKKGEEGNDAPEVRQENVTAVKLFNSKTQLPEDVQERRRSGKLYGDKKPVDSANPFAEFEQMPTTLTPKKKEPTAEEVLKEQREAAAVDAQVKQIRDEMSLEAILNEFGDGTD